MANFARRLTRRRVLTAIVATLLAVGAVVTFLSPKSGPPVGAKVSVLDSARFGPVLVVGSGVLKGFPLYEFSGDVNGTYGCKTKLAKGYDFNPDGVVTMKCTGPERPH